MPEEVSKKLCFVVGPLGAEDSPERIHADWLLEMIVQPVMADFPEFETKRADQITTPGMIDAQVIDALLTAELVIADLSTLNPNAFYEIGIRHMAQKPIIHMQVADEKIPFDVSLYRAIKFSRQRPADLRAAQSALRTQVKAVLAEGYQVENPVTRTRGIVKIEQHATPETQLLHGQMKVMQEQIDQLQKRWKTGSEGLHGVEEPLEHVLSELQERLRQSGIKTRVRDTRQTFHMTVDVDPAQPDVKAAVETELSRGQFPYRFIETALGRLTVEFKTAAAMASAIAKNVHNVQGVRGVAVIPAPN